MYTKRKLGLIEAEYEEILAGLPDGRELLAAAMLQERINAVMRKFELPDPDRIRPFLSQELDQLFIQQKLLELEQEVLELQLAETNEEADSSYHFDYFTKLDQLISAFITRFKEAAKCRLARMAPALDSDGADKVKSEHDENGINAIVGAFEAKTLEIFVATSLQSNPLYQTRKRLETNRHEYEQLINRRNKLTKCLSRLDIDNARADADRMLRGLATRHRTYQMLTLKQSLHYLCEQGDLDGITSLLAQQTSDDDIKALVNQPDRGYLPLHLACRAGKTLVAKLLIEHGADPELLDGIEGTLGRTAIEYAEGTGIHEEIMPATLLTM